MSSARASTRPSSRRDDAQEPLKKSLRSSRSARLEPRDSLSSPPRVDTEPASTAQQSSVDESVRRSFLLPPPTQRTRVSPRPSPSSSSRSSTLSSHFPSSYRGGEGFFTQPNKLDPAAERTKRSEASLPVGVPRPPTAARSSRRSTAPAAEPRSPSTRPRPLVDSQPKSPASSQEMPGSSMRNKRTTTPSPSPPPPLVPSRHLIPPRATSTATRAQRSTTPTYDPEEANSSRTSSRRPSAPAPVPKKLASVPTFPPSSFRPLPPVPLKVLRRAPPSSPARPRPSKRARLAHSPPSSPPAPPSALLPSLRTTDFPSLDPLSLYATDASLLFRLELLRGGPATHEQGGKRGYGGKVATQLVAALNTKGKARALDAATEDVPSWAKTPDGSEWEDDLLRRLSARLLEPSSASASSAEAKLSESFVPLLYASDLSSLRLARLGEAGGTECYLLGREFPCRQGVWTGWIVEREWRERESAWVYAVDDGTAVLEVVCATRSTLSNLSTFSTSTGTSLDPPALLPLPTTSLAPSPRRELAKRKFGQLEARAERQSERTVVEPGRLVRVVGRIEERRMAWETGRRVVASRMDVLSDLNALPAHHLLVTRLHRELYSQPFDVRERLAAIEQAEAEARQREWETASAAGSEWGGMASVASSPGKGTHYRPTRPSKLRPEDLTLSNFIIYIRHHLSKHYIRTVSVPSSSAPSSPATPRASSSNWHTCASTAAGPSTAEYSLPFTLSDLVANSHLALFARRLAQERALVAQRTKAARARTRSQRGVFAVQAGTISPSSKGAAWVAPGNGRGAARGGRGEVRSGAAGLLLPPPSASAAARRERRSDTERADDGPLEGDELEEAVGKVWREALRTMRRNGDIVEWVAPPGAAEDEGGKSAMTRALEKVDELPDLPMRRAREAEPKTPVKPKAKKAGIVADKAVSACPWGDVKLVLSDDDEPADDAQPTPRPAAAAAVQAPSLSACPWGDVKLYPNDDDEPAVFKTPQPKRTTPVKPAPPSSTSPPARQPFDRSHYLGAAPRAAPPPPRSPSAMSVASDTSIVTTGSLALDDPNPQSFQLVTPASLAPLVLSLVEQAYAAQVSSASVTEQAVRLRMYHDDRWAAVARYSEAVSRALAMLAAEGSIERHGQGWRPVQRWGGGGW
ncbi:uncharacterized protein JCM10292_006343 [Rhodotorula paludigena]|uniref:uncharacterized protein n=1 Tax=Rhodotorula paludigena TaxID=86838 RepID=UPI00317CF680